jgi:hypothetical protein
MLEKMGWKGDQHGLGKNQQGTTTNLRAVRRAESLGIGAETDAFGEKGWDDTSRSYAGVLASLQKEYGGDTNDRKEKKRKQRKEEKRSKESSSSSRGDSSDSNTGMRLAQNKVQAGHARKMRDAKDIRNKSAEDMAAVFGVKADFYKGLNAAIVTNADGGGKESEDVKEKKSSKKRKRREEENDAAAAVADGTKDEGGERRRKKKKKKDKDKKKSKA